MCGIFGVLNPRPANIDRQSAEKCLQLLSHRGPDDSGWYESDEVLLGHTRLSIMDLSDAGHQPMSNEDGSVWIVFNGEIYRFWALRAELEGRGHVFRSGTDTEVIIHGYEEWGRRVLERIDGMFSFGLWDQRSRTLLIARDRLGKKPLFVSRKGSTFAFSSQIRPLVASGIARPAIQPDALRQYLFLNYMVGPRTILADVELLPAGTWLEATRSQITRGRYWDLGDSVRNGEVEGDEQTRFESLLRDATRVRLRSDAPVGIFLSGGVDSAVVAAIAQKEGHIPQSTFSVGFEQASYDERPKASRVAKHLGTNHHELICGPTDVPDILPRLTASADHLLADHSMIPLAKLAHEARRSVKVVITGDGADEILAGYPTYRALKIATLYTRLCPKTARLALARLAPLLPVNWEKMSSSMLLARFLGATRYGVPEAHACWRAVWWHDEISELLRLPRGASPEWAAYASRFERRSGWSVLQAGVYADLTVWLVDSILAKLDRTTMAVGLEARSPFLDSRLVEYCFATLLANERRNVPKRPLRRLASTLLTPRLASVRKEPFQSPFAFWFAGPLQDYLQDRIAHLDVALPGIFNMRYIRHVFEEHVQRRRNHDLKLWSVAALSEWCQRFPGLHLATPV